MSIWQNYKQERGCQMHFARLANTLLKDKESARDNQVLACNWDPDPDSELQLDSHLHPDLDSDPEPRPQT